MYSEFGPSLHSVVKKLNISTKQHKSFLSDVSNVADWIAVGLKEHKSMFHDCLTNLKQTATYTCGNIIDIPNDFNCYLLLDLPFFFFASLQEDGYIYLRTNSKNDRKSRSSSLHFNLRRDFYTLMSLQPIVKCKTGRSYQLCYHAAIYPITAHTIVATQLRGKEAREARITFEFLLAVKMPFVHHLSPPCLPDALAGMSYWVAHSVPHFDCHFNNSAYLAGSHLWQLATPQRLESMCVLVRLLYVISKQLGTLNTVNSHLLKHTCINRFEFRGLEYSDRPLTDRMLDIMSMLGTGRMETFTMASQAGYLVKYFEHPSLERDCIKWDVLTRIFRVYMSMTKMPVSQFLWFFGLTDQPPPPKEAKRKSRRKSKKK